MDWNRGARLNAGLALVAVAAFGAVPEAHAAAPRVYALQNATLVPSPGNKIEKGTLVLREGLIESVGASTAAPPDAVPIDATGLWIYPALIDAGSSLGVPPEPEPPRRPPSRDDEADEPFFAASGPESGSVAATGPVHGISRIRPERRIVETMNAFAGEKRRDAAEARRLGFGAVLVQPQRGIFRGRSAVVLLREEVPVPELIVRGDAAQHIAFERGGFGEGYPSSLMGSVAAIRQTLLDAERYRIWSERWEKRPQGLPRPDQVAAFDALQPLLAGRQRAIFVADDPADVPLADRLAREFRLDAAVVVSGFEGESFDEVVSTGRTLLVPVGLPDRPKVDDPDEALDVSLREMRRYLDAPALPARLQGAGVRFALTTRGLKNAADFPGNLRKMIDAGLSEETALAALTTIPASVLGVDEVLGTLEPGKIANVVVCDGPLFAKGTKLRQLFVDGDDYPIEEKARPKGDPNAVVDPRGTWSVVFEFGASAASRTWTIAGEKPRLTGTAETRSGTITFEKVELAGNVLTVVFPPGEGRGATEVTVVVRGETFEGTAEFGSRSIPVRGTRTAGPEGGHR